jgi:hypothetical protein
MPNEEASGELNEARRRALEASVAPGADIYLSYEESEALWSTSAEAPEIPVVEVAPSRWSRPAPGPTVAGRIMRRVLNLKSFGAATTHYPVGLADSSDHPTAVRSA